MMHLEIHQPPAAARLHVRWEKRVAFRAEVGRRRYFRPPAPPAARGMTARLRRFAFAAQFLLLAWWLAGCATPGVHEQRLVAKSNMTFADATAFQFNSSRLLGQIVTGLAGTSGPQNSGCTSCR